MLDIPPKRRVQAKNGHRAGQHQKTEGHLPLAEFLGREPAAEEDPASKSNHPLHELQHEQNEHAFGQRISGRRAIGGNGPGMGHEAKGRPVQSLFGGREVRSPVWRRKTASEECLRFDLNSTTRPVDGAADKSPPIAETILGTAPQTPHGPPIAQNRCSEEIGDD